MNSESGTRHFSVSLAQSILVINACNIIDYYRNTIIRSLDAQFKLKPKDGFRFRFLSVVNCKQDPSLAKEGLASSKVSKI